MQLHLAMAAMLSVHAWPQPGAHVMDQLNVLANLRNPPVASGVPQHPLVPTRVQVVVIHNFAAVGTGHLVLKACVEMLKKFAPTLTWPFRRHSGLILTHMPAW